MKLFRRLLLIVVLAGMSLAIAHQITPVPSAYLMSFGFNYESGKRARGMAKHVPPGVAEILNEHFDAADPDARLDVFYPATAEGRDTSLTTIVWVHGGGWISGSKDDVSNYLKILAASGYTVVGVNYSLAPGSNYPVPVRQVNSALKYLVRHASRFHVDTSSFVLAGDSGGAQIAAQLANIISAPSYSQAVGVAPGIGPSQLTAVILHCGVYDLSGIRVNAALSVPAKTMLRAYSGLRNFRSDSTFALASVINHLSPDFPPMFLSVGNADPLEPQSRALAQVAAQLGVVVDTFFFGDDYRPRLPHEYQFNLDRSAGREALARTVAFLRRVVARDQR